MGAWSKMRSVGALSSRGWRHQFLIAALAASPLILSGYECVLAQTADKTEASRTWESAATAAASSRTAPGVRTAASSIPTNLVPDDSAATAPMPLPPPPRGSASYEQDHDSTPMPPRD